jgi:hypothetical protein
MATIGAITKSVGDADTTGTITCRIRERKRDQEFLGFLKLLRQR